MGYNHRSNYFRRRSGNNPFGWNFNFKQQNINFYFNQYSVTLNYLLNENQWYNITISDSVEIYLDGLHVQTSLCQILINNTESSLVFGMASYVGRFCDLSF